MGTQQLYGLVAAAALFVTGCGDDTTATGSGGGGGGGGALATEGCDGATLRGVPEDTSAPGPWPVGVRTVDVGGLTVEIWYPAVPGSEADAAPATYDLREWLPDAEAAKIPDADAPKQTCDCVRDLPLDDAFGPYPVVFFVHGTAGFRTQSLEIMTHWASRGFVVLAADHPGLYLEDLIRSLPGCGGGQGTRDLAADLAAEVDAVKSPAGSLAFLAGHVDTNHLGMSGHSAGGGAIEDQGDVAEVLIPMAAGGVSPGAKLVSTLVLGAVDDQVVDFAQTRAGYDASPPKKRLAALSPAGHLTFSSLCAIENAANEDIVTVGKKFDVCGLSFADQLFDCDPSYIAAERGWTIVEAASSAALEETLQCTPSRSERLAGLSAAYPEVTVYEETLE